MRLKFALGFMFAAGGRGGPATTALASTATVSAATMDERVTTLNPSAAVAAPEWGDASGECGSSPGGTATVGANGLEISASSTTFGGAEYNGVAGTPLEDLDSLSYTEKYLEGTPGSAPFIVVNLSSAEIGWAPYAASNAPVPHVWQTWNPMDEDGTEFQVRTLSGMQNETWAEVVANYGAEDLENIQVQAGCSAGAEGTSYVSIVQIGVSTGAESGVKVFDFGSEGKAGPIGEGPAGARGERGEEGPPGNEGAPGAEGKQGKEGAPGAEGKPGKEGKAGPEGKAGSEGKAGAEGKQGPAGPEGQVAKQEVLGVKEASSFGVASLVASKKGAKIAKGHTTLQLKCVGAKGARCVGTLELAALHGSTKRTFSIPAGKTVKLSVKLAKTVIAYAQKFGAVGVIAKATVTSKGAKKSVVEHAKVKLIG
jgi:hypothetical protein